ncbi:hypothetical protein MTR_6g038590 [Medicago truncatula]|uniref:Uncharacterized protein n=1 Tax=Medicago truncatula TaxID=3880 RepID=A0A072UJG8_MEDTR|nr:hypothetical protein MTR_6g038590 [Medicago truncatula]
MNNIRRCHTLQVSDLTSIVKVIQISWYLFHTDKIHVLFTISRHHSRYTFSINVEIKNGPDRPVQPIEPRTGPMSGPTDSQNRWFKEPGQQPENRSKAGKTGEPPIQTVLQV